MADHRFAYLRAALPPSRAWLIIDVTVVILVAALVILRGSLVAEATSSRFEAPAQSLYAELDNETRSAVMARFTAEPTTAAADRLSIDTEMMQLLGGLGLTLETRNIDAALMPGFPPRQRVTMVILGSAANHVRYLEHVLTMSAPLRLVQLDWSEGDGPQKRRLALTLEIFVAQR